MGQLAEHFQKHFPGATVEVGKALEIARAAGMNTEKVRKAFGNLGSMRVSELFVKLENEKA